MDKFSICETHDDIKFEILYINQTEIARKLARANTRTPSKMDDFIVKEILSANSKSLIISLKEIIDAGWEVDPVELWTEKCNKSFTSVAAYLFQNKKVQKMMNWDQTDLTKRAKLVGHGYNHGIISTNPDVLMMTKMGSTFKIAQTKWIKKNPHSYLRTECILRDFTKTIGFGGFGINIWFFRKGKKGVFYNTVLKKNKIILGIWKNEVKEMLKRILAKYFAHGN